MELDDIMWRALIICLIFVLAACQEKDQQLDSGLEGYDPHLIENQREACTKNGGRFGPGGLSGTFVCFETPKDANKPCSVASDCDGACLARSRSCSPIKPLLGCNDVLTNAGFVTTVCLN